MEIAKGAADRQHEVIWVPSHGKHQAWTCERLTSDICRKLNDQADRQATLALQEDARYRRLQRQLEEDQKAHDWAKEMLQRQLKGITRYVKENEHELEEWKAWLRPRSADHD